MRGQTITEKTNPSSPPRLPIIVIAEPPTAFQRGWDMGGNWLMTSHYAALWDTLYLRKQQEEHSAWYHGGHIQEAASAAVGVQAYI